MDKIQEEYRGIRVSNFKALEHYDNCVELNPITFLTGKNGSGKSSFVKAFILLDEFLNSWKENGDIVPDKAYLNLSNPKLKLGSFDRIKNDHAFSDAAIELSYEDFKMMPHTLSLYFAPADYNNKQCELCCLKLTSEAWDKEDVCFTWLFDDRNEFRYNLCGITSEYRNAVIVTSLFSVLQQDSKSALKKKQFQKMKSRLDEDYYDFHDLKNILEECLHVNLYDLALGELLSKTDSLVMTLPIMRRLKDVSKTDLPSNLGALIEGRLSVEDVAVINSFIDGYVQSENEYENLAEYVRQWEDNTLLTGQFECNKHNRLIESTIDVLRTHILDNETIKALIAASKLIDESFEPIALNGLITYIQSYLESSLNPDFVGNVSYCDSSIVIKRSFTDRQVDNTLNDDIYKFTTLRSRIINKGIHYNYMPGSFINKWISRFEIGNSLSIDEDDFSDEVNLDGRLLADLGFGMYHLITVLINIENAIMSALLLKDDEKKGEMTVIIEEPESHLHPKLQSMLADMFLDAYQQYGIRFIVETHSEYLLRKSQVLAKGMDFIPFEAIYFSKDKGPYSMIYTKEGKFENKFESGFYDESLLLQNQIL